MRAILRPGDMREVLPALLAEGVLFDAVVTDPPYHLTTGKKGGGFMNAAWDGGDIAFQPETWRAVFDVMRPGAYMVAFASTRGYHRMVCAIEDAGFVIHPMIGWLTGQGFPKASRLDIPGMEGWRYGLQSLKPALEPVCLAQRPMVGTGTQNVLTHGTGALNIDASRIDSGGTHGSADSAGQGAGRATANHGGAAYGKGLGGVVAPPHALGRWPANLLHDGSDEVMAAFAAYGERAPSSTYTRNAVGQSHPGHMSRAAGVLDTRKNVVGYSDTGTAARFFYSSKATAADRAGSKHPTVKPLALMRYLLRLITPPGGHVLDPFAGSGTTLQAAVECGFNATGIEREPEYQADILARLAAMQPPAPVVARQADLFGAVA